MSTDTLHRPSFRLNTILFGLTLAVAIVLGASLPERYPIHFGLSGRPNGWAEGPGMWILLIFVFSISFLPGHLMQRYLITPAHLSWLNVPYEERFHELPRQRKLAVLARVNRMLGIFNAGIALLFIDLFLWIYISAVSPDATARWVARGVFWFLLAGVLVLPFVELFRLRGIIRTALEEEGLATRGND